MRKAVELARHQGFEAFTIGQRHGLGIAVGSPRYVVSINSNSRDVAVGPRTSLEKPGLEAVRFNWHVSIPAAPLACQAQIRAQHRPVSAVVEPLADSRARVRFETPQIAVTPGQVVALYQDDVVIGGGWIERAIDA